MNDKSADKKFAQGIRKQYFSQKNGTISTVKYIILNYNVDKMERNSQPEKGYMMPKEKAQELIAKFKHPVRLKMGQEDVLERAKQCSLIAVDEVIDILSVLPYGMGYLSHIDYWERVKQELL